MKPKVLMIIGLGITVPMILFSYFGYVSTEPQRICHFMDGVWKDDECVISYEVSKSGKALCDPGPVMSDGYCYKDGIKLVFDSNSKLLYCAELFDQIHDEFKLHPSCERPSPEVTCEPIGFDFVIRNNDEFLHTGCHTEFDDWAHLSDNKELVWQSFSTKHLLDIPDVNAVDKPIPLTVLFAGFNMCGDFNVMIINNESKEIVWKKQYNDLCVTTSDVKWKNFQKNLSTKINPIMLKDPGSYYAVLYYGQPAEHDNIIDHEHSEIYEYYASKVYFKVKQNISGASLDPLMYPELED